MGGLIPGLSIRLIESHNVMTVNSIRLKVMFGQSDLSQTDQITNLPDNTNEHVPDEVALILGAHTDECSPHCTSRLIHQLISTSFLLLQYSHQSKQSLRRLYQQRALRRGTALRENHHHERNTYT